MKKIVIFVLLMLLLLVYIVSKNSPVGPKEVVQIANYALNPNEPMVSVDDSRWFDADTAVSANLGEAVPAYPPCPSLRTAEFAKQFQSHRCSVIIVADEEDRFLFWGWRQPVRQRQVGENVTSAVDDIHKAYGDKYFITGPHSFALPAHSAE